MKNGYNILWTKNAIVELENSIEYLQLNFSDKEIKKLIVKIESTVQLISINPELFIKSDSTNIFRVSILKYNTMYYRVSGDNIEILSFFSNRQSPKRRKYN